MNGIVHRRSGSRQAEGNIASEPVNIEASSLSISPNIFYDLAKLVQMNMARDNFDKRVTNADERFRKILVF